MKLSDLIEVFKGHDKVLFKLTGIGETEYGTIEFKDAIDTIEALQQENEQLRAKLENWKHEVQCHMDEVVARDKEIEKLRAHAARLSAKAERAIKALEKQVPQKVKKYKGLNETACPECGIAFGYYEYDDEKFDYCYNCGQKLDWESEAEHDAML